MNGSPRWAWWILAVVCLTTASTGAGCKGCGDEQAAGTDSATSAADDGPPSTPLAVSMAFASRLPAEAPVLLVIRDPAALLARYAEVRPRVQAVAGDVGMVETDLRNTLGIDLARPESLDEVGISSSGGFAAAVIDGESVIMVVASDTDRLVEHATTVLQAQPWNMRADVVEGTVGGIRTWSYGRDAGAPPMFVIGAVDSLVFLLPAPHDAEAVLAVLDAAPNGPTLAADARFTAALNDFDGWLAFGYLGLRAALADERGRLEAQLADGTAANPAEAARRVSTYQGLEGLGAASLGFDITPTEMRGRMTVHADEALDARFRAMMAPSSANPNFARLLGGDTYAVVRASLNPYEVRDFARTFFNEEATAWLEAHMPELQEAAGMDVERFMSAFGGNVLVGATRARLLTLRRVLNDSSPAPGEISTAFGTVVAIQLADADVARDGIRRIGELLEERAEVFESEGALVLQFTDEQVDIGNVVVVDEFLFVVPERNRDDVLSQLRGGGGDLSTIGAVEAQNIVTANATNGAWLNVTAVLEGPIGMAAGPMLPDVVAAGLANFDQVFVRGSATDAGIQTDLTVVFAPLADTP